MEKHEFLELFEAATKAAKSASRGDAKNSPAVSRCVEAIKRLGEAPECRSCISYIFHNVQGFQYIHKKTREDINNIP